MSFSFTAKNLDDLIGLASIKNYSASFPHNTGEVLCEKETITDDILLFKTYTHSTQNIEISQNFKADGLCFNFCLDGRLHYQDSTSNGAMSLKQNDSYIKYINDCSSTISLERDGKTASLAILIKDNFLKGNILKSIPDQSISLQKVSKNENSSSIRLVRELFRSPFSGGLHNIFTQSKILEIVHSELSRIIHKDLHSAIKLTSRDKEALHKARDIIISGREFYDLPTLAKKVAINEFKLKYGFKELFGTTAGQMILKQKMLYAKTLLETSEYSVGEIAKLVGYRYAQSFSNAFYRSFAILPKDLMKKRSYYY